MNKQANFKKGYRPLLFGSNLQYGFLISPTGEGNYYEFKDDGPVEPTMSLQCWESKEQ